VGGFASFSAEVLRPRVFFARIYGVAEDFGLLPRQDYVFMQNTTNSDGTFTFQMNVWQNMGFGGNKLFADGKEFISLS
jgi:hypothetical protein